MGKRIFSILIIISMLLSACGKPAAEEPPGNTESTPAAAETAAASSAEEDISMRFSWWGSEERHDATLKAIDLYMQDNPGISISAEYGDWSSAYEKLVTQLSSGTAPDIIQINFRWYQELYESGSVVDLNTLSDLIDMSGFDTEFLADYCSYHDALIGIPAGVSGLSLLYNKDFFARHNIPEDTVWTWDNLLETGQRVHEEDPNDYLFVCESGELWQLLFAYVKQHLGKQLIDDDYTINVTPELFSEAFAYARKMADLGVTEPFETATLYTNVSNENPKWISGELGMQLKTIALIARYQELGLDYGVTTLPTYDGMLDSGVDIEAGTLYAINADSPYIEEAAEFINWMINDEDAILILGETRGTQPTEKGRNILSENGIGDELIAEAVSIAMENASRIVNNSNSLDAEFEAAWESLIDKVMLGQITPEDAGTQLYDNLVMIVEDMQ